MRLTIVQYAGDYREAWERLEGGGKANYQAQRYSVGFVGSLAQQLEQVTVLCAVTPESYDVILPNGVRAIGCGLTLGFDPREVVRPVANSAPHRLVLVTPMLPILRWARRNRLRVLATLADSFQSKSLWLRWREGRLAAELNQPNVSWVANHGIAACLSLIRIGVKPDKVIPWDWPPSHMPTQYQPRTRDSQSALKLIYVGSVIAAKGVGDLLRAVARLKQEGLVPALTIVGSDAQGAMRDLASRLGLGGQVNFVGVIPNEDIPATMRSADVVIVPSRHEYPEGLPLTIYEALASRTPIIASDHPMFFGALTDNVSALVFRAGDIGELAASIRRLNDDSHLYAKLSRNSLDAWMALRLPVTWGELVSRWLDGSAEDQQWLQSHSMVSGLYETQIGMRTVG